MDTPAPPPVTTPADSSEDKTVAIVSYLTFVGFIVAIVLNSNKKTKLGAFHLRQMLGFFLTSIAVGIAGLFWSSSRSSVGWPSLPCGSRCWCFGSWV